MANKLSKTTQIIILVGIFAVSVAIGYFGPDAVRNINDGESSSGELVGTSTAPSGGSSAGAAQQIPGFDGDKPTKSKDEVKVADLSGDLASSLPSIVSVSTPEFKNGTFSFKVRASCPSGDALIFQLLDSTSGKLIADNTNGSFYGVMPSNKPYKVIAVNVKTNQKTTPEMVYCKAPAENVNKPESDAPATVDKVSKETLTSMINRGNYSVSFSKTWVRDHMSNGCRYVYTGLREDELKPDGLADLCDRVNMEGWRCTVTSIEYNQYNQITKVTIHITYSE